MGGDSKDHPQQPAQYSRIWRRLDDEEIRRWEWAEGESIYGDWNANLQEITEPVIESNYKDGKLLFEARHDPEHIRSLSAPKDPRFERAQRNPPVLARRETGCLTGIDHAVAITSNAEANIAFYEGVLGLELARNSSESCAQHGRLSYRRPDTDERPFLHFIVGAQADREQLAAGPVKQLAIRVATFGVYEDSFWYWGDRLDAAGVKFDSNGDQPMIWFKDPDGISIRIDISWGSDDPDGPIEFQPNEPVPANYQLASIGGMRIASPNRGASAFFMRHAFGCALHDQREAWARHQIFNHCGGTFLNWVNDWERPTGDAGHVHHVALRCPADELVGLHRRLSKAGVPVEEIADHPEIDAKCFLFREPGGALLEIAAPKPQESPSGDGH